MDGYLGRLTRHACLVKVQLGKLLLFSSGVEDAHQRRNRSRQAANMGAIPMLSSLEYQYDSNVHSYKDIAMQVVESSIIYNHDCVFLSPFSITSSPLSNSSSAKSPPHPSAPPDSN
jgi:uncharacterized cupin superfamily protein